jgi:peptide/nickel transport system ATP-binding protein
MSDLLSIQDLKVWAAGRAQAPLVRETSFSIQAGTSLTLLGESGSGKSLLAHAIMGTLPGELRASGHITLGAERSRAERPGERRAWWGRRIALLPQEPWLALDPTMRSLAQVSETHRFVRSVGAAEARTWAREDFARLGLEGAAHKYPFALSGGMAQRVAFAATCAGGAPVLIADEPTKGLDHAMRDQIVTLLRGVIFEGGIVLCITHDVEVARALGGQVAVMRDSEVLEQGPAEQVLTVPVHPYTAQLLSAQPQAWDLAHLPPSLGERTVPFLVAERVGKRYADRALFRDIDLSIRSGERVAITGPSGSGKTTFGNVLLGLVRPDRGVVRRLPEVAHTGFQKLYQDPVMAFAPRLSLRNALSDLLKLHGLAWSAVEALMPRLKLSEALLGRLPAQVSGGELQRFALLRMLLLKPALVFADEPTSRLDPLTQKETFEVLLENLAGTGSALLLVTHDQDLAAKVAQRQLVIGAG